MTTRPPLIVTPKTITKSADWFIANPNLALMAPVAANQPFDQTDWPLPRAASKISLGITGISLALNAAGTVKPFLQADWPVPKAPQQFNRGITRTSAFLTVAPTPPFPNTDWPLVKAPLQANRGYSQANAFIVAPRIELLTMGRSFDRPQVAVQFTQGIIESSAFLAPDVLPFAFMAWKAPAQQPRGVQTWAVNLLGSTLAANGVPFAQTDWPIARTLQNTALAAPYNNRVLLHYFGATPVYPLDWPLPVRRVRDVLSFTLNLLETTLYVAPPVTPSTPRKLANRSGFGAPSATRNAAPPNATRTSRQE